MNFAVFFLPLSLILLGLWQFFGSSKVAWSFQQRALRRQGITGARPTPEWNNSRKIRGLLLLIGGVLMFFLMMNSGSSAPGAAPGTALDGAPIGATNITLDGTPISPEQARSMGLPVD